MGNLLIPPQKESHSSLLLSQEILLEIHLTVSHMGLNHIGLSKEIALIDHMDSCTASILSLM